MSECDEIFLYKTNERIKWRRHQVHLLTALFQNLQKLFERNWSGTFGHIDYFKLDGILHVKRYTLVFILLSRMQQRIIWNGHFFRFFGCDVKARFGQCYQIVTLVYDKLFKCFKTCNFILNINKIANVHRKHKKVRMRNEQQNSSYSVNVFFCIQSVHSKVPNVGNVFIIKDRELVD